MRTSGFTSTCCRIRRKQTALWPKCADLFPISKHLELHSTCQKIGKKRRANTGIDVDSSREGTLCSRLEGKQYSRVDTHTHNVDVGELPKCSLNCIGSLPITATEPHKSSRYCRRLISRFVQGYSNSSGNAMPRVIGILKKELRYGGAFAANGKL